MFKRWIILLLAITFTVPAFGQTTSPFIQEIKNDQPIKAGWNYIPFAKSRFIETTPYPFIDQINQDIKGTGIGKTVLLWKYLDQVMGEKFVPHKQGTGDCVSHAFGLGVDILGATQICMKHSPQQFLAPTSTEIIYAGARYEIGKTLYGDTLSGEGTSGIYAAQFIKEYGILLRQRYLSYDFTNYSAALADKLGRKGVPDELEALCKLHPVGRVSLLKSYAEVRDCIANGYPVIICSNQGFNASKGRDKDGFLTPSRSNWNHAMCLAGVDDNTTRPGVLCINSWGTDWLNGPKRLDQPDGSFWIDASVIDKICKVTRY